MNSRFLRSLAQWVITLLLPVFLVFSTLYILMTDAYVGYEYNKPGFPMSVRFPQEARYHNAVEGLKFIRGERTLEQFIALGVWNEREIKHMLDVRGVVLDALTAHALAGTLILGALVYLLRTRETRRLAYSAVLNGSILTIALIASIGIFSAVAFNQFFTLFHFIFFEGDTWLFPVTDSLIQLYPPIEFQAEFAYAMVLFAIAGAIIVGGVSWWLERRAVRVENS